MPRFRENVPRRRIGELLVEQDVVSATHLSEALAVQKERGTKIIETLIGLGYLDVKSFLAFLARQPGVASIDLGSYEIPRELVTIIPRDFAVQHEVFPIDKMGRHLTVGMACPLDAAAVEELETLTGLKVRPLLCPAADIHAAIERYYPAQASEESATGADSHQVVTSAVLKRVESALRIESMGSLVRQVTNLPPLPDTVHRLREAMASPDISMKEIAKILSLDPSVAAKLLSLANSPAYGFASRVTSVQAAISLLGLRETYAAVLAAAAMDFFEKVPHFDHRAFWDHARFCATASAFIAQFCGVSRKGGIFAAGLLHDIGRIVMAQIAPERYARVDQALRWNALVDAEKEQFMIAHTEIGYLLAEAWHLPKEISDVIRFHHEPTLAHGSEPAVAVVVLANAIAHYCPESYSEDNEEFLAAARPAMEILGLKDDLLPTLHASLIGVTSADK